MALTHSSYAREHRDECRSNERLEFLGDAFLDAIIGEEMYKIFSREEEGFLSRIRATLVCEESLAQIAAEIEIGECLFMGHGEEKTGGRQRKSILADAMEAVFGAIYLDGGYEAVKLTVLGLFANAIEDARHGKYVITDYKTALQEALQAKGITDIRYVLEEASGPDHDKTFRVGLMINGRKEAEGIGKSKKQAEQQAAGKMLERER